MLFLEKKSKTRLVMFFLVLILVSLAFLSGASYVRAEVNAPCAGFNDVEDTNQFCAAITFIRNLSITSGCGGGNFCPTDFVRREQMAQFMRNMLRANATGETYIMDIISQDNLGTSTRARGRAIYGLSNGGASAGDGVWGQTNRTSMAWAGLYGVGTGGASGVYGATSDAGPGVRASSSGPSAYALHAVSGDYRGAYVQGAPIWYDAYFGGDVGIFVNGSCTGCTMALIVQNNGSEALEPGDVVAITGITAPLAEGQNPVITVSKANADNQQTLVGVVTTRYVVEFKTEPVIEVQHIEYEARDGLTDQMITIVEKEEVIVGEKVIENGHTAEGAIMPGDYLMIVHDGMAQVRVDANMGVIQVGDMLVAGPVSGHAITASNAVAAVEGTQKVIGQALEAKPDGQGLIWVLIKIR